MTVPPLTYLTTDSLAEGVGASQVLAYVRELAARGVSVELHSFEKVTPDECLSRQLREAGVDWVAHPFGAAGARGGLSRVLRGAAAVRGRPLVHARSDLPAASALLSRAPRWVWDVRSLWADQRIALGALRAGSPEHRVLTRVEAAAAERSSAVVTLSRAVLPVLDQRHGGAVSPKAEVIPTCVDLDRFAQQPLPTAAPLRLLLAGTLNGYYDVPAMVDLVAAGRRKGDVELSVLSPSASTWAPLLESVGASFATATPAEMPARIAACHVGLSVCRSDAGVSLTAAMPTKIAEFLAVGRPVVVNEGLGDAAALVREYRAGVVLGVTGSAALADTWDELVALVDDPGTPARCRQLAQDHFDVKDGVTRLLALYERIS